MLKIIISTDFSENAQKAIDYALNLFKREECIFYLLHAYHDAPSALKTKLISENDLMRLAKRTATKNDNPKHHFETVFQIDSIVNLINRTVIDKNIGYVFMGTRGLSAFQEIFLGSITVEVLKHLDTCPIVAVPKEYEYNVPEEIIFSTDYKHAFLTAELAPLIKISKLWDSKINVIHIDVEKELSDDQKMNKALLENSLKKVNSRFIEVKMEGSISSTLYQIEKENPKIGMVSLLNTQHGFFQKLLREPVIKNMTLKNDLPLLVLRQIVE